MSEKKRPGVMLYFEQYDILRQMPMEDSYALLMAIFEFARNGVVPQFKNPALVYAWGFLQQSIERDSLRYDRVVEQKRKASQKRWAKARGSMADTDGTYEYA